MKYTIILALLGMAVSGIHIKQASRAGETINKEIAPIEHNNIQLSSDADTIADVEEGEDEGEPCEPALDVTQEEMYI